LVKRTLAGIITLVMLAAYAFTLLGAGSVQASGELFVTILHTNDEHSALVPSPLVDYRPGQQNPALGGFARMATFVKAVREKKELSNEPVLLISGGDFLGGSPYAWLALNGKAAELSLMIELGYDVVTIGNHEYDYGPEILAQYLKAAGYPSANARTALVASNTLPPMGHPLNDVGIKKTHIKVLENGLKVGFFGLIGKDAISVAPFAEPVEFSDQAETARAMVAELRAAGVDLIIAVTHAGVEEDIALAREVPGINVIIGGHCHTLLTEPVLEQGTIIVQSGELMKHVGYLELGYDRATGKVRIRNNGKPFVVPLDHTIPSDPRMTALVAEYTAHLNNLITDMTNGRFTDIHQTVVRSRFIVNNQPPLQESPFGNFITDAMRFVASEATGHPVHIAIQANGVIRGRVEPGTMPWSEHKVSFFDLAGLVGLGSGPDKLPGYPLVSVWFTGEELRRIFEVQVLLAELMGDTYFLQISGARLTYAPNRAIMFTVPFAGIPVPSTRAVLKAELFTGTGLQGEEDFVEIKKGDTQLYHVVTDYYIASFLPMVGDLLPSLRLVLKDKDGKEITNLDDAIIYRDGKELKVWQAVMEYAASQPKDAEGNPWIPNYYQTTSGRLNQVKALSVLFWPLIGLGVVVAGGVFLIIRRKRRKKRQAAA
jgi:UDP-sugar diphosphatase